MLAEEIYLQLRAAAAAADPGTTGFGSPEASQWTRTASVILEGLWRSCMFLGLSLSS